MRPWSSVNAREHGDVGREVVERAEEKIVVCK
jgi:hypothetical protein